MIKQLVLFITLLLLSLSVLPSCTIFGSDETDVGAEDYYEGEGEEGSAEEGVSVALKEGEGEAAEKVIRDAEEDVYYIDEEDEDIIEDDIVVEEESDSDEEGEVEGGESEEYVATDEADAGFFSSEGSGPSQQEAPGKQNLSAPKKWVSYKKIKTQPYNQAGFLVNAVYIARKGDDIQSISNKIFGSDQVDQLQAINLFLKRRGVKVGDKIYYQSPNRPQDSGQLLFYFEDKGIPPQYHQAQAGENIRQIASQLLGDVNSWKEVWATNPDLQSKGVLNQSVTFKYWPEGIDSNVTHQPVPELEPEPPVPSPEENNITAGEEEPETPLPPDPSEEEMAVSEQPTQDPSEGKKIGGKLLSEIDIILAIILALGTIFCAIIIVKKRNKRKEFDYTATNFKIDED